jgi:hypothetical protein
MNPTTFPLGPFRAHGKPAPFGKPLKQATCTAAFIEEVQVADCPSWSAAGI